MLTPPQSDAAIHANQETTAAFSGLTYGGHFDDAAKLRMIAGCRLLAPWISEFSEQIRGNCAEFGPFLNPLLEPEAHLEAAITFIDGDAGVVSKLREKYRQVSTVQAMHADLNSPLPLSVRLLGSRFFSSTLRPRFNALVVSQVLNYIDYRRFFAEITPLSAPNALLFLNNVIDYGIPEIFSERRPDSDSAITRSLESLGWVIVRRESVESPSVEQEHPRLLLVARRAAPRSA